jgi:hypothetical protein
MSEWVTGGRRLASCVTLVCLLVEVNSAVALSSNASRLERVLSVGWKHPAPVTALFALGDKPQPDSLGIPAARRDGRKNANIIGTGLFASGLFLCSWGITSWQMKDDQCCPPRNAENVIKIVVGIVLIDAGLVYLLGGAD